MKKKFKGHFSCWLTEAVVTGGNSRSAAGTGGLFRLAESKAIHNDAKEVLS